MLLSIRSPHSVNGDQSFHIQYGSVLGNIRSPSLKTIENKSNRSNHFKFMIHDSNTNKSLKAPYSSKIDICFIQESFTILMYSINTIIITKTRLFKYIEISPPKTENFHIKNSAIFHISAENKACGYPLEPHRRGGSYEYQHSMFRAEIRKIMYTPVNPRFTI